MSEFQIQENFSIEFCGLQYQWCHKWDEKKIIINTKEEKNKYISVFFFFQLCWDVLFFGREWGIRTKMISLTTYPRKKCYTKHLVWQRPRSMYVFVCIWQIFEISLANELKFTLSLQSYLLTKAARGCNWYSKVPKLCLTKNKLIVHLVNQWLLTIMLLRGCFNHLPSLDTVLVQEI